MTSIVSEFSGKERDAESGLDYFGARYFSSPQGRFTTPDPLWIKIDRVIDPQRLNLYAYGHNNPLKYSDPTGMDVILGKCSGGNAQKCFDYVLKTIPEIDRSHLHVVTGNGSNGFKEGQFGVSIDESYQSTSKNFQILQAAANNHGGVAVLNVVKGGAPFASNVGVQEGNTVVLKPFKSIFRVDNYVNAEMVPGQTLFPLIGKPLVDTIYAPGSKTQVYVANDQPEIEIVKTLAHEMVHVFLGDFGRTIPKSGETAPGVKAQLNAAEDEAAKNYRSKQP